MTSDRRAELIGVASAMVPGAVMLALTVASDLMDGVYGEEDALVLVWAVGTQFGLGAAVTALLARTVQRLRPRRGLEVACKGMGWANLAAAILFGVGLLLACYMGDLWAGVSQLVALLMALILGAWLRGWWADAPPAESLGVRRRPWSMIAVGLGTFVACAGLLYRNATDSIPVPPFDIEVQLSDSARQKLEAAGETIEVAIYFDGDGEKRWGQHTAPFRDVVLGSHVVELHAPGRMQITSARILKEAVGRLTDPNYHFFINVVSGRRVFKDNVLSVGYADGRKTDLSPAKPIVVRCGL